MLYALLSGKQIVQLLEIASQTCKTLATTENNQQEIITLSSDYLNLIKVENI